MGNKNDDNLYPAEACLYLPVEVRQWLEGLRPDDIKEIKDALKMKRRIESGGWLFKWVGITVVSFFVGTVALGESFLKVLSWFSHIGKPL